VAPPLRSQTSGSKRELPLSPNRNEGSKKKAKTAPGLRVRTTENGRLDLSDFTFEEDEEVDPALVPRVSVVVRRLVRFSSRYS